MVDFSDIYNKQIQKNKNEFKIAKNKGDFEIAKQNAKKCAELYNLLGEKDLKRREEYNKKAKEWEKIANYNFLTNNKEYECSSQSNDNTDICRSFLIETNVNWDDIGGLNEVKRLLKETIVIAGLNRPDAIKPWKGILLFGPPGTGKTMIAAAAAGSLQAKFFDVKADQILSKYFGESSKMVASLYQSARDNAPSIVFIDEFDALGSARGEGTSEASRKLLSSLLTELDGLQDKKYDRLLLTMAATNTPWDIDPAILSRFPRRIYVTLPDKESCASIINLHLKGLDFDELNIQSLAEQCTEKLYSGRDIQNLCQQAIWAMIHDENPRLESLADLPFDKMKEKTLATRRLVINDFNEAFQRIRSPLQKSDLDRYQEWNEDYGEGLIS